jgi:hypothetical protein
MLTEVLADESVPRATVDRRGQTCQGFSETGVAAGYQVLCPRPAKVDVERLLVEHSLQDRRQCVCAPPVKILVSPCQLPGAEYQKESVPTREAEPVVNLSA